MVIAQFWAFANDIYTQEQGKRLFPLIGVGSSLGAWLGSVRAGQLVETRGPMRLLVGAAVMLVVCAVLWHWSTASPARTESTRARRRRDKPLGKEGGFELIRKDRYLMLIAMLTVLLNVVNTSGEYLFGRYVVEQANRARTARAPKTAAARERVHRRDLQPSVQHREPASGSCCRCSSSRACSSSSASAGRCSSIRSWRCMGYLLMLRAPSLQLMAVAEGRGQQPRLLPGQHHEAGAVAADQPRGQVQGEAGGGLVLRARRRRRPGAVVFAGERLALAVPAFAAINVVLVGAWLVVAGLLNLSLRRKAEASRTEAL